MGHMARMQTSPLPSVNQLSNNSALGLTTRVKYRKFCLLCISLVFVGKTSCNQKLQTFYRFSAFVSLPQIKGFFRKSAPQLNVLIQITKARLFFLEIFILTYAWKKKVAGRCRDQTHGFAVHSRFENSLHLSIAEKKNTTFQHNFRESI